MTILRFSSWTVSLKIFVVLLSGLVALNLMNIPLNIGTFSQTNRQVFRQVVMESALRQEDAITEDFDIAFNTFQAFQKMSIQRLLVSRWLKLSDPTTEGFSVDASQAKHAAELAIWSKILSVEPTLFRQVWLIDANGQVIANVANIIDPRFDVSPADYVDVSWSPAHQAGVLLGMADENDRKIDLVVEETSNRLSLQLVSVVKVQGEFMGTVVAELNNVGIILSNIQPSGVNNDIYSFVASPANSSIQVISLTATPRSKIRLDTLATRASQPLARTISYVSGDRQVLGYYTPLFDEFRNDIVFVVELDETVIQRGIATSVINTTAPTLLLEIFFLLLGILFIKQIFIRPIERITDAIRSVNLGDFRAAFLVKTGDDEIGRLSRGVIDLRRHMLSYTQDMTNRMDMRAHDLHMTQEISRAAILETNLDQLTQRVVDLVVQRFTSISHAQIFLINGSYAVLKASTGDAGKQRLTQGHHIAVGSLSLIGQVAQQGDWRLIHDIYTRDMHRDNEFFDDTRVELAIPMRLGARVIGVLDIHSSQQNSFDDDLIAILEMMADQIAITIENVRLHEELQDRLRESELLANKRDVANWQDFMATQRATALVDEAGSGMLVDFTDLRARALETQQEAIGELTHRQTIPIAVPIIFKSQALGVIEWETPEQEFTNQIALAKELSSRLALSLDNARLIQAGRQTAMNESIINTISSKLSKQTDIEQIIQTTIQQIGHALHTPYVTVRLHSPNDDEPSGV